MTDSPRFVPHLRCNADGYLTPFPLFAESQYATAPLPRIAICNERRRHSGFWNLSMNSSVWPRTSGSKILRVRSSRG